jgi:diguanylate cyclase (GGDEF)-like protein
MPGLAAIAIFAAGFASIACGVLLNRVLAQRKAHLHSLQERSETINRLLAFSQTIQGAGRADQIFPALGQYLRDELTLSGLAILTYSADAQPPIRAATFWPVDLVSAQADLSDMDTSLCPCLRQNLPWHFEPDNSPVRCVLDASLKLPLAHAAYCIPFTYGRRNRVVVHMLLAIGQTWTESRKQIAQAYVNASQATLSALELLAEAERQSVTDSLTSLYNRRSLDHLLTREVALAERHNQPLAVVMVDLDYFKSINDAHGHAAGDYLLKAFADCVRITLRKTDLAFRFGGDEFVIALPQTTLAQAQQVMQKLRQAYASVDFSNAISRLQTQPTLSMGVAERSAATHVLTMTQLLSAADQALYAAKTSSRDCIKVYEPPKAA